jgi:hypothetical protein
MAKWPLLTKELFQSFQDSLSTFDSTVVTIYDNTLKAMRKSTEFTKLLVDLSPNDHDDSDDWDVSGDEDIYSRKMLSQYQQRAVTGQLDRDIVALNKYYTGGVLLLDPKRIEERPQFECSGRLLKLNGKT